MEYNDNKIGEPGNEFNTYLEKETTKLRAQFDQQRAKMKELYLQKEVELNQKLEENNKLKEEMALLRKDLDDLKSQLVVADLRIESNLEIERRKAEEIASWQTIVYETVEQSSTSKTKFDTEIVKLQSFIYELQKEIGEMKAEKNKFLASQQQNLIQETSSLAPSVVFSAVTKKIVKKLDAFSTPDDTFDEIKNQEDTEVVRSLYSALEEEIKVLKDKLRSTDEKLQKCRQCGHFPEQQEQESNTEDMQMLNGQNVNFDDSKRICVMCSNYEAQLVKEQDTVQQLNAKVIAAEKTAAKSKEDLIKEIGFRKEMEEKWNEKREEHKILVADLTTRINCTEQDMKELRQAFQQTCKEINVNLGKLTEEREEVQRELQQLQNENDYLVGKYSETSEQLEEADINLPDTVEELHELILNKNQGLIIAKIAKEAAEENANMLRSDITLLNDKLQEEQQQYSVEIDTLREAKMKSERDLSINLYKYEDLKMRYGKLEEKMIELNKLVVKLNEEKKTLETNFIELKNKTTALQKELDNSEVVQQDFVKLSQTLQVQLEKIRDSDSEVRWQHEEDIEECPSCKLQFGTTKRKQHCKHCGHIFCVQCLSHTVKSGPNERPSKVCVVCHTLLVKTSAPYFSTAVPQLPD